MEALTVNEMKSLLMLLKEPSEEYNARTLGKKQGITPMGALKILKKMGRQNILKPRKMGNAVYYEPNLGEEYPRKLFEFLLRKEAEEASPRVRRWVREARKLFGKSEAAILFGSVLEKEDHADVDLLLILTPAQGRKIDQEMEQLNSMSVKKIHAVKQTKKDLVENVRKKDPVVLNALSGGIIAYGYEKIVEAIADASR